MAEHKVEYATATGNDYAEHEATYLNIVKLAKVGTVGVAAVVVSLGIYGTTGSLFWTAFGVVAALIAMGRGLMVDSVKHIAAVLVFMLIVWAFLV
jgi:hypothetical protein